MHTRRSLRGAPALFALVLTVGASAASSRAVASTADVAPVALERIPEQLARRKASTMTSRESDVRGFGVGARYAARGVIRGFGANREHVNIAHEEIPGYMRAMTMAFEFESAAQSAGLSVGDAVRFTFEELPEGRFVLRAIARQ